MLIDCVETDVSNKAGVDTFEYHVNVLLGVFDTNLLDFFSNVL